MGDPKKHRKKYTKPSHPWQRARIDDERALVEEYGFKNKREIWKMNSFLRDVTAQSKKLVTLSGPQAVREKDLLLDRMRRYGLISSDATLDSLLSITPRDVLERRLQTLVFRKHLASSSKQARQFIVHGHVMVGGKKVTSPSYLVPLSEDASINFAAKSSLADAEHPERVAASKAKEKRQSVVAGTDTESKQDKRPVQRGRFQKDRFQKGPGRRSDAPQKRAPRESKKKE